MEFYVRCATTTLEFQEEQILQIEAGVKASLLEGRLDVCHESETTRTLRCNATHGMR